MYQLTFTLQQHTPMIHFHNQPGATLRGTEIKPKLDRFILKYIGDSTESKEQYAKWIISEQNGCAFDYKIKILATNVVVQQIGATRNDSPPFFFANLGPEYRLNPNKFLSFCGDPIKVEISSFNTWKNHEGNTIIEFIKSIIPEFFLSHNFGTRQSKGYGSFYIQDQDPLYVDPYEIADNVGNGFLQYSFELDTRIMGQPGEPIAVLKEVEVFYKAMRSGLNYSNSYLKSLIWIYFKTRILPTITWEKKKIKGAFLSTHPDLTRQFTDHSTKPDFRNSPLGFLGTDDLLIKDLFGLACKEKWEAKYFGFLVEKVITGIERFKSPIFFKILKLNNKFKILFHASLLNINNSIVNKTVTINGTLNIPTPATFDFHEFFDFLSNRTLFDLDYHFLVNAYNLTTCNVEYMRVRDIKRQDTEEYKSCTNYKILKRIFNQLQQ